ncbi:MAG TPA: hydrogenase maturation nickel metallochaperone HypA [Nitrospira sp.]|nr:hydrogenase maturation nickel metallochaperone HypA [Nitrospira sp.]
MHEISIAQQILDLVIRHLPSGDERPVKAVRLKLGARAGVSADSLEWGWKVVTELSVVRSAALIIEPVPSRVRCTTCGTVFEPGRYLIVCPRCRDPKIEIISGDELQVMDIELID